MTTQRDFLVEFLQPYFNIPPLALWRAIEARLLSQRECRQPILDLGCCDGVFAAHVFLPSVTVYGSDLILESLRQSRRQEIYAGVFQANACQLPIADSSFPTVFSNCVFEHIPDERVALLEVARVLEPGGEFIFTVPSHRFLSLLYYPKYYCERGRNRDAEDYISFINARLAHYHYHSQTEWVECLGDAGLTLVEIRPYLHREVVSAWDRWTRAFITPLLGKEIANHFRSRWLYPLRWLSPLIFAPLLRRYESLEWTQSEDECAAWLIRARKIQ